MKFDFIRQLIFILIFLILSAFINHKTNADDLNSTYTLNSIQIDGKLEDWSGIGAYFDTERQVSLAVANDGEYLYVKMHTKSQENAHAIRMTGVKLYVDNGQGDKKDFYIRFNGGPDIKLPERENQPESEQSERSPQIPKNQLICYDKERMLNKVIPTDGSEGPAAAYGELNDVYVYEFRIPLHKSTTNSYGKEIKPGKKFKIGLVWGDRDDMPEGMKPPGGGMRGGMGGFGGNDGFNPPTGGGGFGGRGGGMPPGGKRPGRFQIEKQEFWIKSILASASTSKQEE